MSRQNKPRIGVIGCGHWGRNYVRLFSGLPQVELAAVAEPDPAKRQSLAAAHPQLRLFNQHTELLQSGLCDAVVVATIASTHHAIVRDALQAGLDVLAEKPFTLRVAEAEELTRLAEAGQRVLMVAHTFLFNPSVRLLKRYVVEGVIGDVYYVKARRTHLGLVREDVNAVWDLAPHDVSMLLYLLEESPVEVQAVGRRVLRKDREDAAFANLLFPSGVIAQLSVSWADSNKERYLDIVGSKSRAVFDDLNVQEPVRLFYKGISVEPTSEPSFGEFKYLLRDGEILSPKVTMQEPLRVLCEEFIAALVTRQRPYSDAAFGTRVVEVLCRIAQALAR
jgi:predicted dehydrogenase